MRGVLFVALLVVATGCDDPALPPGEHERLAASDAVRPLRADESPYHIIYSPPVDLAKRPTPSR